MDPENTLVTPPAPPHIRQVGPNRGVEWLAGGFRMFMKTPGSWVIVAIALIIGSIIIGKLGPSWLDGALISILGMVALGTLMRYCQALDDGSDASTGAAQATAASAPLWILGLIAAGMSVAMSVLIGIFGLSSLAVLMTHPAGFFQWFGLNILIMFAVSTLITMSLWLAPALVVLKGISPLEAVRMSFLGSVKNIIPYIISSLLATLLCIVAALPFGLGLLVALPMVICACYLAYKDIFTS